MAFRSEGRCLADVPQCGANRCWTDERRCRARASSAAARVRNHGFLHWSVHRSARTIAALDGSRW